MSSRILVGLVTALALGGCSSMNAGITTGLPDLAVAVADAGSSVTVTKTTTPDNPATPANEAAVTYEVGEAGSATFVFSSRPGSLATYITGYRVTSDVINGTQTLPAGSARTQDGLNIYVPSGYTCVPQPAATQSCAITDPTATPANSASTAPYSINLSRQLADVVKTTSARASRSTTVVFTGVTSGGRPFELPPVEVSSEGLLNEVTKG